MISESAIRQQRGLDPLRLNEPELAQLIERYIVEETEIHFHTFSKPSFKEMLTLFCQKIAPHFTVMKCQQHGGEIIAVLQKRKSTSGISQIRISP